MTYDNVHKRIAIGCEQGQVIMYPFTPAVYLLCSLVVYMFTRTFLMFFLICSKVSLINEELKE